MSTQKLSSVSTYTDISAFWKITRIFQNSEVETLKLKLSIATWTYNTKFNLSAGKIFV